MNGLLWWALGCINFPDFSSSSLCGIIEAAWSRKTDQNSSYFTLFLTNFEVSFLGLSKNPWTNFLNTIKCRIYQSTPSSVKKMKFCVKYQYQKLCVENIALLSAIIFLCSWGYRNKCWVIRSVSTIFLIMNPNAIHFQFSPPLILPLLAFCVIFVAYNYV